MKFFVSRRGPVFAAVGVALVGGLALCGPRLSAQGLSYAWSGYGHDAQHTALSQNASQPLNSIRWQTPVDDSPPSGGALLIHYGSPLVTAANTVIVPVRRTDSTFRIEARKGKDGSLIWSENSDYVGMTGVWGPPFSPVVTPRGKLAYPSAGGVVTLRDAPDSAIAASNKLYFFGATNYNANPGAYNTAVKISSPITSDRYGNLYFSYVVNGSTPLNLKSGVARIGYDGVGTFVTSTAATGDGNANHFAYNCAPALSRDQTKLYIAATNGGTSSNYLVMLDARNLRTLSKVALRDVLNPGNYCWISDSGTSTPTVGPDGDVYYGVLENPPGDNHYRGWLRHFNADLSVSETPGAFGWDDSPSIVPSVIVPSYKGRSPYLLMVKYNNYAGAGGDGVNRIAVLDPNDSQVDSISGATVMREILTQAGPTKDSDFPNLPNAVREWCINTAAVDPINKVILANCEDGVLYRWDLKTNTISQRIALTTGRGEAYTPTVIGVDGTVYAINDAKLFAVGYKR